MKSISARLTLWYALTATTTLACLFVVGYFLLENRLIRGLDLLNEAEFKQIKAHLGEGYESFTSQIIDARIRETTDYASVLFYIEIEKPKLGNLFRSSNLAGRPIPDVKGQQKFNVYLQDVGELRVGEFFLKPFDVAIGTPLVLVRETMTVYVQVCVALIVAMMLISIAVGFGLSQLVLRPIRLISETADRIRSDNLRERIPVPRVTDELSGLARLLNQMFDRLEVSFDQIRRFTADASHELKTPLSLVRLHAEKMLTDGGLVPEHEEAVLVQLEEITRLNHVIEDLLFLSRADANVVKLNLKTQKPAQFLQSFLPDARALVEHSGMRLTSSHEGRDLVAFEERWIRQVLLNLLTNAIHVSPPQGEIRLRSVVANSIWRVSVEDEGPGLTAEQCERVFERFVRFGHPDTEYTGTGLGLAICRSIVELHRGSIFAQARTAGTGLMVVVEIPAGT